MKIYLQKLFMCDKLKTVHMRGININLKAISYGEFLCVYVLWSEQHEHFHYTEFFLFSKFIEASFI